MQNIYIYLSYHIKYKSVNSVEQQLLTAQTWYQLCGIWWSHVRYIQNLLCIVPIFYNQLIEVIFVVICSEKQPVYVLAQDANVKKIIHGNLALQGKTKYT